MITTPSERKEQRETGIVHGEMHFTQGETGALWESNVKETVMVQAAVVGSGRAFVCCDRGWVLFEAQGTRSGDGLSTRGVSAPDAFGLSAEKDRVVLK